MRLLLAAVSALSLTADALVPDAHDLPTTHSVGADGSTAEEASFAYPTQYQTFQTLNVSGAGLAAANGVYDFAELNGMDRSPIFRLMTSDATFEIRKYANYAQATDALGVSFELESKGLWELVERSPTDDFSDPEGGNVIYTSQTSESDNFPPCGPSPATKAQKMRGLTDEHAAVVTWKSRRS